MKQKTRKYERGELLGYVLIALMMAALMMMFKAGTTSLINAIESLR